MMKVKKLLAMPDDLWREVENYRWRCRIPSESEAMRRLIEAGLDMKMPEKPQKTAKNTT